MPADAATLTLTLAEVDALLVADPQQIEARYLRASLLAAEGRTDEARQAYLELIGLAPTHFGALNDLGTLLYNADFRSAAKTCYAEAVKHHPHNPVSRINLANTLLAEGGLEDARMHYAAALDAAPDDPDAHQGMANLLQDLGESDAAETHRQKSYAGRTITALPYRGTAEPCRVLLLASAAGGNLPTRFLLDDRTFFVNVLAAEAHTRVAELPPHDLVFNAIGDADLAATGLAAAQAVEARTPAPMINPPERVMRTGRAAVAERLSDLPDVIAPRVARTTPERAAETCEAFGYPLLVRSLGFHTGRHFMRVETPADLPAAVAALPGRELLLIEPLDARDAQGLHRKFRVMIIGGGPFPLHLALSRDWKVHYFTADMADQPHHRAQEAAFLEDMPAVLGPRALQGLAGIARALDLDYAGVDFGLSPDGEVLLFEANAAMSVYPPGPEAIWDYRRAPVRRVLEAAQALCLARAGRG